MILRTRFLIPSITLGAALLLMAGGADEKPFRAGAAADYAHQTSEQVTVGAKPFDNQELTTSAFGKKMDLLKYGVLPVLVVVENKRGQAIDMRNLEVSLVAADGRHVGAVSPEEIPYLGTAGKRHTSVNTIPLPVKLPKKKGPLSGPELIERAFSAKVLPPGDSASGFFYFEARPESGDSLYLGGLRDSRSQKEILYLEFPLVNK